MEDFNESEILMKISDGYSVRTAIEILQKLGILPVFKFDKDGMSMIRGNETKNAEPSVLVEIRIRASDLTLYTYKSPAEFVTVPLSARCLKNATTGIGRGHEMIVCKKKGESKLNFSCKCGDKKSGVYSMTPMKNIAEICYKLRDHENEVATCVVEAKKFSPACTSCGNVGPGSVLISVCEGALRIQGCSTKGEVAYEIDLGESGDFNLEPEVEHYVVHPRTLKAMIKFQNMCQNGNIKCYAKKNEPLKFELDIGHHGLMIVRLKSLENDN